MYPNLTFHFSPLPKMTLISTPLSRVLIGKPNNEDIQMLSANFKADGLFSGFLSIDSKNRLCPWMPNDPLAFS